MESLLALQQLSIESSNTFNMVLGFAIIAMIMGFGGVLFYIFLSERSRRHDVVRTATNVADIEQENITLLSDKLRACSRSRPSVGRNSRARGRC